MLWLHFWRAQCEQTAFFLDVWKRAQVEQKPAMFTTTLTFISQLAQLLSSIEQKVYRRLMGMSLVLQLAGHKSGQTGWLKVVEEETNQRSTQITETIQVYSRYFCSHHQNVRLSCKTFEKKKRFLL